MLNLPSYSSHVRESTMRKNVEKHGIPSLDYYKLRFLFHSPPSSSPYTQKRLVSSVCRDLHSSCTTFPYFQKPVVAIAATAARGMAMASTTFCTTAASSPAWRRSGGICRLFGTHRGALIPNTAVASRSSSTRTSITLCNPPCCTRLSAMTMGMSFFSTTTSPFLFPTSFHSSFPTAVRPADLPKRLILIRHGESEANVDRSQYARIPDWRIVLTPRGKKEARDCGQRLRRIVKDEPLFIYYSPYKRTRQTLDEVRWSLSPLQIKGEREDERLREQEMGNYQPLPASGDMDRLWNARNQYGRSYFRFPAGESGLDVMDRVGGFFDALLKEGMNHRWWKNELSLSPSSPSPTATSNASSSSPASSPSSRSFSASSVNHLSSSRLSGAGIHVPGHTGEGVRGNAMTGTSSGHSSGTGSRGKVDDPPESFSSLSYPSLPPPSQSFLTPSSFTHTPTASLSCSLFCGEPSPSLSVLPVFFHNTACASAAASASSFSSSTSIFGNPTTSSSSLNIMTTTTCIPVLARYQPTTTTTTISRGSPSSSSKGGNALHQHMKEGEGRPTSTVAHPHSPSTYRGKEDAVGTDVSSRIGTVPFFPAGKSANDKEDAHAMLYDTPDNIITTTTTVYAAAPRLFAISIPPTTIHQTAPRATASLAPLTRSSSSLSHPSTSSSSSSTVKGCVPAPPFHTLSPSVQGTSSPSSSSFASSEGKHRNPANMRASECSTIPPGGAPPAYQRTTTTTKGTTTTTTSTSIVSPPTPVLTVRKNSELSIPPSPPGPPSSSPASAAHTHTSIMGRGSPTLCTSFSSSPMMKNSHYRMGSVEHPTINLSSVEDDNDDYTVVIVSHGLLIRLFIGRWFGIPTEKIELLQNPPNCSLIVLERARETTDFRLTEISKGLFGNALKDVL